MITTLFNNLIFDPILFLLVFLYQNIAINNLGIAIVELTILVRIVLFPLFYKSAKDQTLMQKVQPLVEKIRKEHKDDKSKQAEALMALYKEHKLNPFSGFLMLLIQLPIFLALFQLFRNSEFLLENFQHPLFLGINLSEASLILTVLTALAQYFNAKLALNQNKMMKSGGSKSTAQMFGKMSVYFTPLLYLFILQSLPSALALYLLVSTILSLGQQFVINKKVNKTFKSNYDNPKLNRKPNQADNPGDGV